MRIILPIAALLSLVLTGGGAAQEPSRISGPARSRLTVMPRADPVSLALAPDSVQRQIPPTHWKTGALVGGVAMGIGMAVFAHGFCRVEGSPGDCGGASTGGFVFGAVVGGLIGAFIGGQVPKDEDLGSGGS
jgi:hypothetical protein